MLKKQKKYQLELMTKEGSKLFNVTRKKIRRIIFRFDHEKSIFNVSVPHATTLQEVKKLFYEKEDLILNLSKIKRANLSENYYYFGQLFTSYQEMLGAESELNREQFYALSKKGFLMYLQDLVATYEKIMNIPLKHKVRVKIMKTRWGTNSLKTRTLTFNHHLIHYHQAIIEAIVIHELAHYFIGGHQASFYKLVETYCPNYQRLAKNLKRGNYANN